MSSSVPTSRGGLGPIERVVRILGGGLLALFTVNLWLTTGGFPAWAWFAAALLGLDFVFTGIRGYCPLYARLGIGRPRTTRAPLDPVTVEPSAPITWPSTARIRAQRVARSRPSTKAHTR